MGVVSRCSIRPGRPMPWRTYAEPVNGVRVGREASAASELLLAGRSDEDGVLHRSEAGGVERAHVEDVDALHLTENLETLETGGLLEIGGDGAGLGTRTEEILLALDLCLDGVLSVGWIHDGSTEVRRAGGGIEAIGGSGWRRRTLQSLVAKSLLRGGSGLGSIACKSTQTRSAVINHTRVAIGHWPGN